MARVALLLLTLVVAGSFIAVIAMTRLPGDDEPRELPGIHNVVSYQGSGVDGFYSGGAPEGAGGFESLARLGVRTVISVDGAIPDVAAAKARGMRYVHLPIGYDGFDDARMKELVRAVRDLPKPIYLHCHHGKHRSACAAGTVAVSLGWMTNAQAAARMKVSGTSEAYTGLWDRTARAGLMTTEEIDAASTAFPEVTRPDSMVASMVAVDEALERIRLVEKNGWVVPKGHPDLAPAADAGKIADLLRLLVKDGAVAKLCDDDRADFIRRIEQDAVHASALEESLASAAVDAARRDAALKSLSAGCRDCHARHRD